MSKEEYTQAQLEEARRQQRALEVAALTPITFADLQERVGTWMLLADVGIVKFLCAVVVANRMERDPIWAFVIGPSGGGKTELVQSLLELQDTYPISLLTTTTFLSGMPGANDASLLPRLDKRTMVFLDWTNLLAMNKDARNEIMGQLRDIYGGYMKKVFGNGKVREWRGKVGLLACVTQTVDFQQQTNAPFGERFINYRIRMPDPKEAAMRALHNGDKQEQMRTELRNAFISFFKGLDAKAELPELPPEIEAEIVRVANFSAKARSGVIREYGMKKEVMFVPAPEMPTRLTQQLYTLTRAMAAVDGSVHNPENLLITYKVALDSIPQTNRMVIMEMARRDSQTTKEIATALGYPTAPIRMYLENLALLGICRRTGGAETDEGGTADRWTMEPEFVEIIRQYEKVAPLPEEPAPPTDVPMF